MLDATPGRPDMINYPFLTQTPIKRIIAFQVGGMFSSSSCLH